jgi:hypothetical protein
MVSKTFCKLPGHLVLYLQIRGNEVPPYLSLLLII